MATNWTGTLLSGYGLWDQADRIGDLGEQVNNQTQQLAGQQVAGTQFKPYTVTSNLGNTSVNAQGGIEYALSPELGNQYHMLRSGAEGMFQNAMQPTAQREQDIYGRIRAAQTPEEQRAQLAMESRLQAQGRSGIQSSAFGGTPEQLAYHKAVQESQNNAYLMAMQQAQAEQMQQGRLGGMFQEASFVPNAQMANLFNPSINTAQLQQQGQLAGQDNAAQLQLGGLQSQINAEKVRAELLANLFGTMGNAANNSSFDPVGDVGGGLWDWLKGQF
jgi:hypothetical protein